MRVCLFIMAGLLLPQQSLAQEDYWSSSLFVENDLFANTDLNYTSGVRWSWISPDVNEFLEVQSNAFPWIARLNESLTFLHPRPDNEQALRNFTVSLGQLMFTPQDKYRITLDPDDRPYSGWLYLGLGYQARTEDTLHSVEVNLGMVGPAALARQTQDLVHDLHGIDGFRGWHNQQGNEPGIQVAFERKRRHGDLLLHAESGLHSGMISHWGGSLGNVSTHLDAGLEFRLGWNLPADFGASTLRPGGDSNAPGRPDVSMRPWQFHGFLTLEGRAVLHNIFLDGNTFRDSHSVHKKALVADLAAGLTLARRNWRLTYAHVYRSREFDRQRDPQLFGALTLTYTHDL